MQDKNTWFADGMETLLSWPSHFVHIYVPCFILLPRILYGVAIQELTPLTYYHLSQASACTMKRNLNARYNCHNNYINIVVYFLTIMIHLMIIVFNNSKYIVLVALQL